MDICVSIIIPCYNTGKYIDETIKSVLKQTFQDFEILIINDGSTDELTLQLLNNSKWNKTKIYHIENCGVASARNYGIRAEGSAEALALAAEGKNSTSTMLLGVPTRTTLRSPT